MPGKGPPHGPVKETHGVPGLGLIPDTGDCIILHAGPKKSGTGGLRLWAGTQPTLTPCR